jgi:predicted anti-sigma-YlaC factor YlaD
MMSGEKTCKYFCDSLSDYLDGEIGPNECVLIEEHLKKCLPCATIYKSLKTTVDLCCRGVSAEIPEDVSVRLRQFLREHCRKET